MDVFTACSLEAVIKLASVARIQSFDSEYVYVSAFLAFLCITLDRYHAFFALVEVCERR